MKSYLRWVDFSNEDRERMQRAIALLAIEETRDELGLGTIRDLFAGSMFPGTSTIQTRLRYFLFVPWMYQELETRRTASHLVAARARQRELALIEALLESEDTTGVLGKRAREHLKRLPSSIYWAGLGEWGIRLYSGSQHQYHRAFSALVQRRSALLVPEDEGVELSPMDTWYPRIPPPPSGWPEEASFDLTLEEAEFFKGRIEHAHGSSLLAWLAREASATSADFVWAHPDTAAMRAELQQEVDLARRFSLVMHGASLLYNVILAELSDRSDMEDAHRHAMDVWVRSPKRNDMKRFDLVELWEYVDQRGGRVPPQTRTFVERWVKLLRERDPKKIVDDDDGRKLVSARERALKGPRSRIANRTARKNWSGASGVGRIDYRWRTVRGLLNDLHGEGPRNQDPEDE